MTLDSQFHRAGALARINDGADDHFSVDISPDWTVGIGANGGYASSLLVNAVVEFCATAVAPNARLRSITSHYLRPPTPGPAEIRVTPVRLGRSMSIIDATMARKGKDLVTVRAAVGTNQATDAPGLHYLDRTAPDIEPPDALSGESWSSGPSIRSQYDTRYAYGEGLSVNTGRSVTGGWIRTTDDAPVDVSLAVALTDCWIPAPMTRVGFEGLVASTVDLTSHVFADLTEPYEGWVAVHNESTVAIDGYVDTDTEVWTDDGRLLAQGRQLSVLIPMRMD